ncbi:SDR family NAD(P)-dependent oxidoreductase [Rhodococcus sp. BP-252]|uniref:oxidoreductase n=1 Tax=unclassified Rhodococcus (in: high G+C Gram-positive bacteria) TaxID=192944 RepID=UPI001C9B5162|nr:MULTISPECIES: oxidoreductase [unclassified Rhodococcus (in: high G+C Gram-positive bacteria)]MBY6412708.1 SDR family NAD(P)-dependent oxidoreductase [Rhodococcus sp. BP-320]MBY6417494.1 SDR family NAD(P)-dependent oxidoreductase [Rhodococcus sp. BP-321]MBY6421728.1 SDR family NAD(P)-dependent oxidoreductase [Rhodococcus sp. BP-324]MBY6427467.1 SDR family NAD(P)-dependent oxidoreductase [Rhodococcus sp. BP-323]MBY6432682.1 SDR family NAD(P)-dependent oxidoreductase [Rhodococcus sp. BP-322]
MTSDPAWTASDIPDLTGRRFIVTGANSGLGEVTARALGKAGADVVLACRDTNKGDAVARSIGPRAHVRRLDLADLGSVREFAHTVDTVDVLINNAGVMAVPNRRTVDGFEMQFGTNHLGHFALTGLLLPRITDRVVTMSSGLHQIGRIHLDDPNYDRRPYRRWGAYGQSKLANLMFALELDRRLAASGSSVKSLAAHPGYARTNLQSHTETVYDKVMGIGNLFAQSAERGALPELYAATSAEVTSGLYIGPDGPFELRGYPTIVGYAARVRDRAVAAGLWEKSEALTGVTYRWRDE